MPVDVFGSSLMGNMTLKKNASHGMVRCPCLINDEDTEKSGKDWESIKFRATISVLPMNSMGYIMIYQPN